MVTLSIITFHLCQFDSNLEKSLLLIILYLVSSYSISSSEDTSSQGGSHVGSAASSSCSSSSISCSISSPSSRMSARLIPDSKHWMPRSSVCTDSVWIAVALVWKKFDQTIKNDDSKCYSLSVFKKFIKKSLVPLVTNINAFSQIRKTFHIVWQLCFWLIWVQWVILLHL